MDLFSSRSLETEFRGRWTRLERVLADMGEAELAEPETLHQAIEREAALEVPTLQRHRATFPLQVMGTSTEVTMHVPHDGHSNECFHLAPEGTRPSLIEADPVGGRGWEGQGMQEFALVFSKAFPGGTSSTEVKAWGKSLVDRTEEYLDALRPQVEQRMTELRAKATNYAATRLSTLRAERELREGLGEGI